MDYSIFYKKQFPSGYISDKKEYDFFISGFDSYEGTLLSYSEINAQIKVWLIFPHYSIPSDNLPLSKFYTSDFHKEDDYFQDFFSEYQFTSNSSVCIDMTGFIKPHLLYLIKYLASVIQVKSIDFLYTEPLHYAKSDETRFSHFVQDVRLVEGCTSMILEPPKNDLLIISAGYDDELIQRVCQKKSRCSENYYIVGFPSLQPDMYQESALKLYKVRESLTTFTQAFAPASDPFITAQLTHDIISSLPDVSNIYLSPLGTKPQALGFMLYFLYNQDKSVNIIYPFSNGYSPNNAIGIKKTWRYTVEL